MAEAPATSWLIQRLQKPFKGGLLGGQLKDNPFSFGGGYKNGGLSDEAMDCIRDIWSFDYMGAAEYEWGAVPEALNKLAKNAKEDNLTTFVVKLAVKDVPRHWRDKSKEEPEGEVLVYGLAPKEYAEEFAKRVFGWATGKGPEIRDHLGLTDTLRPEEGADPFWFKVGWLELDNGFMFFTDEEMWRRTCELFGVAI